MKFFAALATTLLMLATTAQAQGAPSAAANALQGEVLEVQDAGGYTYLRLKTRDGTLWAAVMQAPVKKGAQVTIARPMVMENFESKALNRRFDRIVFGQLETAAATSGAAAAPPHPVMPAALPPTGVAIRVAKAPGADAKTVAELVKGKAGLKDKTVVVRGQVVKVSLGIKGKNWLHLRDGTGTAADGSDDIPVTTRQTAALGDVVTARGTVRTNVTVGPGYDFAVLLEDAVLSR